MSKNSMSKKININFEDYKKLSEINLLEIFLKESIILETIKESIPQSSKDKELLIKSWFKKFDKKITNELIDFPLKEISNEIDFFNLLIRKSLWIEWCKENFSNVWEVPYGFLNPASYNGIPSINKIRNNNKNCQLYKIIII